MAFCDFVVYHDITKDKEEELTRKILYSVLIKRLKAKKPAIIFIGGDSGEGKSYTAITLQLLLLELQGIDIRKYFHAINVYTPIEYPEKLDGLLYDKELKKVNIICMHEAREVVKAKRWQSFLTQAISDVNAMSRSIKRLAVIIISQFIRDITPDIRYTLNYYCIVRRPKGKPARMYINVLWKDDRDLEKPRLRKRKLSGYIVDNKGHYTRYIPQYIELKKPPEDLCKIFDKADFEAKTQIIRNKTIKLISEMKSELNLTSQKIEAIVKFYSDNPESLALIGRRWHGKFKLKPEARQIHELTKAEANRFETLLNEKFKEKGIIEVVKNE